MKMEVIHSWEMPVGDLINLEEGYKELLKDYNALNKVFEEATSEIDFKSYGGERQQMESWLIKLKSIEKDIKNWKKRLDRLKSEISN